MDPKLTLCIPTNGIIEWVFPVLDSIYKGSEADEHKDEFEVVVTDNGKNQAFKEKMRAYATLHSNLNYQETNAYMFNNQLEAFQLAKGNLIKFINHRTKLLPGCLKYLLNVEEKFSKNKPILYFLNGNQKIGNTECDSFDAFVRSLGIWSTWSGGIAMWKEDFEKLPAEVDADQFFPHMAMLFAVRDRNQYIIDNAHLLEEIPADTTKKGNYNLFEAFASRFPEIMLDMVRSKDISLDTFLSVKEAGLEFCANLYVDYVIRRQPCSYSFENKEKNLLVFYGKAEFKRAVCKTIARKMAKNLLQIIKD